MHRAALPILFAFLAVLPSPVSAADITAETCHSHRAQQIAELERNRQDAVTVLSRHLEQAADEKQRAAILAEIEQSWDHEERFRGVAETQFRDCMAFVKSKS